MLLGLLTSAHVTENKNYCLGKCKGDLVILSVVNYIFNSLKSKPEDGFKYAERCTYVLLNCLLCKQFNSCARLQLYFY